MKLTYAKNNIIANKNQRKFLIVFWVFPRLTHQDASIELLFVKFGSVGASEEKDHSKKNSSHHFNRPRAVLKISDYYISCALNKMHLFFLLEFDF